MAGYVGADRQRVPGSTVLQVVARQCPATGKYGEVCQQYDPHSGAVHWCAFMYGFKILSGGWHRSEARSPGQAAAIMAAADDAPAETYTVMCLRQASVATPVGALRPE